MISVEEAQKRILSRAKSIGTERISIHDALGRSLAEDLFADRDYPPFNRSMMDGYALRSSDFNTQKIKAFPVLETVQAGATAQQFIEAGNCIKIMTGAPVPKELDVVIRVEDSIQEGELVSFTVDQVKPWQSIAAQGQDRLKDQLILPKGNRLKAAEISLIAVLGLNEISVYKKPSYAILSTGDELVVPGEAVLPHQIRDSNSYALKGLFDTYQMSLKYRAIVKDQKPLLREAVKEAMDVDILILSGGVSMGDADFVPDVLIELGIKKVFHKIEMKPGKPLWFGEKPNGGVVFALPGNPKSCQVAFKVFIEPYLRSCMGLKAFHPFYLPLKKAKKKISRFDEYFSCQILDEGLLPYKTNSSGDIKSTALTHGLALHPAKAQDLAEGALVAFYPWENNY